MDDELWVGQLWLRAGVYARLTEFGVENFQATKLTELLGYQDIPQMTDNFSDRDQRICRLLLGPNGRCIYQMLEARKQND